MSWLKFAIGFIAIYFYWNDDVNRAIFWIILTLIVHTQQRRTYTRRKTITRTIK